MERNRIYSALCSIMITHADVKLSGKILTIFITNPLKLSNYSVRFKHAKNDLINC